MKVLHPALTHPVSAMDAVVTWLMQLADVVTCYEPVTEDRAALYAEMLLEDLPASAFSGRVLKQVAEACETWPSYKRLKTLLLAQEQPEQGALALTGTPETEARTALAKACRAWSAMFQSHRDFGWVESHWPARAPQLGLPEGPRTLEAYTAHYARKAAAHS